MGVRGTADLATNPFVGVLQCTLERDEPDPAIANAIRGELCLIKGTAQVPDGAQCQNDGPAIRRCPQIQPSHSQFGGNLQQRGE
jgi:hypothetical protein